MNGLIKRREMYGDAILMPPITDYFIYLDADNPLNTNARWYDYSVNNYVVEQTEIGNQPVLTANEINGKNAYVHVWNRWMTTVFGTTYAQPNTIIMVWRTAYPGGMYAYDGISSTARNAVWRDSTYTERMLYGGTEIVNCSPSNTYSILTSIFNGSNSKLILNNTLKSSGGSGAHSLTGMKIGASYTNGITLRGAIASIIGYNRVLTTDEITSINNYLKVKYGL